VSVTPILLRSLRYGAVVSVVVGVIAGVVGYLLAGTPGLVGALVGVLLSALFMGLTAVSILIGGRATKGDPANPVFFAVVLGAFGLKLVLFLVFVLWLRSQTWLDAGVFGVTAIATVIGSLAGDILAFVRTRMPYVSDVQLPGEGAPKP
jgi:hypothetical protein